MKVVRHTGSGASLAGAHGLRVDRRSRSHQTPVVSNDKGPSEEMVERLAAEAGADLRRFLRARLGNARAADDTAQEAFLRLHVAQTSCEIRNPRGFLFAVATNLAIDVIRKRMRRDRYTQPVGGDGAIESAADRGRSPEQRMVARQQLEAAIAVIDDLPPKCQQVFLLHRFEGLSYTDIARRLGITKKGVEYHMTQALSRLRGAEL
jgi:RNA polymerase sigma factor (sigma-70 family)